MTKKPEIASPFLTAIRSNGHLRRRGRRPRDNPTSTFRVDFRVTLLNGPLFAREGSGVGGLSTYFAPYTLLVR
jgi:hypothetical protein